MTNCKVLSFKEIHETNKFFKDCEQCVNLNYRKNLELEYENDKKQQAKTDLMYWKDRARQEQSDELAEMYSRFQKSLQDRENNMKGNPEMKPKDESLETSFNYEVSIPSGYSTPRDSPLRLDELSGPVRTSNSNARSTNSMLNSAENLIRRLEAPANRPSSTPRGLAGPNNNLQSSAPPRLMIDTNTLANSLANLRRTTTRPASEAPASNASSRVQLINELTASLASRASRGRRSSNASYIDQLPPLSVGELTPPGGLSPQQLSPESSEMRNPNQARAQRERRFREEVVRNMPARQNTIQLPRVDEPSAGSGLKKRKAKAKKKKSNSLM